MMTQIFDPINLKVNGAATPHDYQYDVEVTDDLGSRPMKNRFYYSYPQSGAVFRTQYVNAHLGAIAAMSGGLEDKIAPEMVVLSKTVELSLPVARQATALVLGKYDGKVKGLIRIFDATHYIGGTSHKFISAYYPPFLLMMKNRNIVSPRSKTIGSEFPGAFFYSFFVPQWLLNPHPILEALIHQGAFIDVRSMHAVKMTIMFVIDVVIMRNRLMATILTMSMIVTMMRLARFIFGMFTSVGMFHIAPLVGSNLL